MLLTVVVLCADLLTNRLLCSMVRLWLLGVNKDIRYTSLCLLVALHAVQPVIYDMQHLSSVVVKQLQHIPTSIDCSINISCCVAAAACTYKYNCASAVSHISAASHMLMLSGSSTCSGNALTSTVSLSQSEMTLLFIVLTPPILFVCFVVLQLQDHEEHVNFKNLLLAPQADAQMIMVSHRELTACTCTSLCAHCTRTRISSQ
jgi:ABC-type molybdenum transport system ATPase subunit/photorepair protein PhrA